MHRTTLYLLAPGVVSILIKSLPESILQFTIAVVAIAIPMAVSRELRTLATVQVCDVVTVTTLSDR